MIREVTMYQAACDACGKSTADLGLGEHWAWADMGTALTEWQNFEGLVLDDGRLYCWDCVPPDVCRYSNGDGAHTPNADGTVCEECDADLLANAIRGLIAERATEQSSTS